MILRKVVGRSMAEALRRLEKEIGPDALIVETRHEGGRAVILARRSETGADERPPPDREPRAVQRYHRGFRPLASRLLRAGLSQHLVSVLYRSIRGLDPHLFEKGDPSFTTIVERVLAALIPVARPEQRRVVTLVGPTGTGKTTTIAKLMARALLEKKQSVAVVTIDTFRIAAVEQLRAFAEMMDVPFRVAFTPQDLRQAVRAFEGRDRIFIDTTGRSPRDRRSLHAMRGFFRHIPAEVHLCLPAGGRRMDLDAALESYGCFDPRCLVLTKCDETSAPGESLSLAIERNHPVSFTTCGQRVPEDLSPVDPRNLASLVMGTASPEQR